MKIVIETGSGSHSTSSASCQVKFVGGQFDGQYLYSQKQFQVKAEWDTHKTNEKWVTTEYNLPEGTIIAVMGKGQTGPRGVNKHEFHRHYRLDPSSEVLDELVDVGLRDCILKGRLVQVRDLIAERTGVNLEEGF
jgi:hypothetical protein